MIGAVADETSLSDGGDGGEAEKGNGDLQRWFFVEHKIHNFHKALRTLENMFVALK